MLRAAILLLSVLASIGLVYLCGFWILLVLFAIAMATVLCSTGDATEEDLAAMGTDTGYRSTFMAKL